MVTDGDPAVDNQGRQLTYNGQNLYLHYGTDNSILEARTSSGVVGFSIDIDPVTNTYTIHSNGIISNGTSTSASDLRGIGGGHVTWMALNDIGNTAHDVMMSTKSGEYINTSQNSIGISRGQSFTAGESIRLVFLEGLQVNEKTMTIISSGTYDDQGAYRQQVFTTAGTTSISLTVTALVATGGILYGSAAAATDLSVTDIHVYNAAGTVVTSGFTLVDNGSSVTINGLKDGWTFEVTTDTHFNAIQIDAGKSGEFKLGLFSYGEESYGSPVELSYDLSGTDGDGDPADGVLHATLYPATPAWTGTNGGDTYAGDGADNILLGLDGNDTLHGGEGNDTLAGDGGADYLYGDGGHDSLYGGSGNDHLYGDAGNDSLAGDSGDDLLEGGVGNDMLSGGLGDDTLTGGDGADTFKTGEGNDFITDYSKAAGDKVDISAVLDTTADQAPYLGFHNTADGKAVLEIYNSSNPAEHNADHSAGSVTFDNIHDAADLSSLLGQIDLDHTT